MTPRCLTRLQEVHPALQKVISMTDELYDGEFIVTEGRRTIERQKELVADGKSKTEKSRHVPNNNVCLLACAVDLACWFDKDADKVVDADELSWKFPYYLTLAGVVKFAAIKCNIPIRWGGSWTILNDTPNLQVAVDAYVARCKAEGRKPLVDGPHFELPREQYL